jgi:tetratricopeptide (TPR) repeat protein
LNPSASSTNTGSPTGANQSQVYVTGKVMVEDGGELPANVLIQKICGATRNSIGYADQKGNFSVKVTGQSATSLLDASDDSINTRTLPGQQQSGSPLNGCEIQAYSAGYRSQSINIGSQRALDNPNIGLLIIKRIAGGSAGTSISETMRTAPKNAVKAYEHGLESIRKGKLDAAQSDFEKAVELHPQFASAWYQLGHLQMTADPKLAQADFEKALSADPKYLPPYADLALLSYSGKRWQETISITDRALRLDSSSFPQLYYFSGVANFNLKNMTEAEKRAREAIKADVDRTVPRSYQLLSYVLAGKGDYAGAAEQMRVYIASAPSAEEAARGRRDLAKLESKINEIANR